MIDDKNTQQAKIKHGLPPKRDPVSYRTLRDILIPAGTTLRAIGDDEYACSVGFGDGMAGEFTVTVKPDTVQSTGAAMLQRQIKA